MQRPWEGTTYWFSPQRLPTLLSYRTHGSQHRGDPSINRVGSPPSIANEENALSACLQPGLIEFFSQLKLLFLDDSGLYQGGISLVSTQIILILSK